MILSFFTQKSTRSAKLSSVFAERFSGEGQADFAINKAHKVSLKGRNNLYISCVFNGFKYISEGLRGWHVDSIPQNIMRTCSCNVYPLYITFFSKTGVCRGIPIFLIFAPKHRWWVLIRTTSVSSNVYPQYMF